jgi:hypothetical protein
MGSLIEGLANPAGRRKALVGFCFMGAEPVEPAPASARSAAARVGEMARRAGPIPVSCEVLEAGQDFRSRQPASGGRAGGRSEQR